MGSLGTARPDLRPRLVAIDKLGGGWGNFTKYVTDGKMVHYYNRHLAISRVPLRWGG
jgi:hypothetical protein